MSLVTAPLSLLVPSIDGFTDIHARMVSVNFHLIKACNYRCKFCFAHFNQVSTNYLPKTDALRLVKLLANNGTKKITFVGGEPTLVPYLPELVIFAKSLDMTTMIVTNGTKLSEVYLSKFNGTLDWVGLSVDSGIEAICKELGRGTGYHVAQTLANAKLLRKFGIKVKLNTVINQLNWQEDMSWLIKEINPMRWKVFKMLPIEGENDAARDLLVSDEQYQDFIERHQSLNPVVEGNDTMIDSYLMIDPEGRFFSNHGNQLHHGREILKVGIEEALQDISFKPAKLIKRGGIYQWEA